MKFRRSVPNNLVEKYERRPAPWDEPFFEMRGAHMMCGADWTKLRIGGEGGYLLTMIDFFSRKIISWKILMKKSHLRKNTTSKTQRYAPKELHLSRFYFLE